MFQYLDWHSNMMFQESYFTQPLVISQAGTAYYVAPEAGDAFQS